MSLFLWIFLSYYIHLSVSNESKIVCYFSSDAVYRKGKGSFQIANIDPTLCTHLIYAFVGINPKGDIKILNPTTDLPKGKDGYNLFNKLRKRNPSIKTLISIGGWGEKSVNYSIVAGNSTLRKLFAYNAVNFVKKYKFNGLDFDWEYPTLRGGMKEDKENFVLLLKEMKKLFEVNDLLLSAALGANLNYSVLAKVYDISRLSNHVDWINLMTYDYYDQSVNKTSLNAPLFGRTHNDEWNINASVHYWLTHGAPREKLILGMPFYGRTFSLKNLNDNEVGAPTIGKGKAGPYTNENGTLGYVEICEIQKRKKLKVHYIKKQQASYLVDYDQWITFDDVRAIRKKAEFIKKLGLGGAMIWSIENDDAHGICEKNFILLRTLNKHLRN